MCVDSSTNTKADRNRQKGATVTCLLSLKLTATATDPPTANSPIMHSRLVCKDPKTRKNFKTLNIIETAKMKTSRIMPKLVICSSTKSLKSTGRT